ncbi:MAG: transporter substrate-binding domain-containing protein [Oscillospiraceae bacterium]|nr:transporter substrate-binding domain-containing protein [Oscillospiraceae bacterium]
MKKFMSILLAVMMLLALCACGNAQQDETQDTTQSSDETKALVYAVEAGSAGEAAALEAGYETVSVDTQAKALMEVAAGTSDAAIIDSLMAGAMVGEGTSYPDLVCTDEKLTEELYGVGCRKGSDLAAYINKVMADAYADGTMQSIAETYGVQEALVAQEAADEVETAADGDVAYIQDKGTLVVGITDFAPMDYKDENGEWIGFDADMAKLVAEKLGVAVEFIVIDWDNKVFELDGKGIDVVWNGMTLTDAVVAAMECTNAYCNNAQVVVTAK